MLIRIAKGLASAFLAGSWSRDGLLRRGCHALDGNPHWLKPLVRRLMKRFRTSPIGGEQELIAVLSADERLQSAVAGAAQPIIRRWFLSDPSMLVVAGPPANFPVFPLASLMALRRCLSLTIPELEWFADRRGMNSKTSNEAFLHYRYRWIAKARGGFRLLEAPKPRLKVIQRWILRRVLVAIPASPHAHGFVRDRSVRSFVEPHVGRGVVVRMDLEDFFGSVSRARVAALLRRVGYPTAVAATLAGLATAATPEHVLAAQPRTDADAARRLVLHQRLRDPHLPQGAPTSPALANLAAWRLDQRLAALARGFGATMTRYADDLAFSGEELLERNLAHFIPKVGAIVLDEGFRVNVRKTHVMRKGRAQQLCGVVVNERPNLPRSERDNLRALLNNAARLGPKSQNRAGHPDFRRHLEGRIRWVMAINPGAGARLAAIFANIRWDETLESQSDS